MYEATTAANEILRANGALGHRTTPLQLIKLLYIAHGFSLAMLGRPLFSEPVQAWKFGPVVKSVYHKAKRFGRGAITSELPMFFSLGAREIDPETRSLIAAIAKRWGNLPGTALSNWTHLPNSPWAAVYRDGAEDIVIPNDLICSYFQNLVRQNKNTNDVRAPATA